MRWLAAALLMILSGCVSFPGAHLVTLRSQLAVQRAEVGCGPIALRRTALGARWGEYLKVTVSAPTEISGEVRLYVDRRPSEPVRFSTSPWALETATPEGAAGTAWTPWAAAETPLIASAQQVVVLDAEWSNEQLDVDSALSRGAPLELSVSGLDSVAGGCAGVTFTVEQGVLQPSIAEGAWVAELQRRAGPEWAAKMEAQAQQAAEIRQAHWASVEARHAAERASLEERTLLADTLRAQHYAEWERRREIRFAGEASGQVLAEQTHEPVQRLPEATTPQTSLVAGVVSVPVQEVSSAGSCGGVPGAMAVESSGANGGGVPMTACPAQVSVGAGVASAPGAPGQQVQAWEAVSTPSVATANSAAPGPESQQWNTPVEATVSASAVDVAAAGPEFLEWGASVTAPELEVAATDPESLAWSGSVEAAATAPAVEAAPSQESLGWEASIEVAPSAEVDQWALPPCLQRVAVSRTVEAPPPSPVPQPGLTVEVSAADAIHPLLGFLSAVGSVLLQGPPVPHRAVHRAVAVPR